MFADDASVYASVKNIKDLIPAINNDLGIISDWFKANELSLNIEKTNYVVFTKIKCLHIQLFLNNTEIEQKTCTKFLGVIVDENLNWKAHIKQCKAKLACSLYALNTAKRLLNQYTRHMLYYSMIYPYLTYGVLLWGSASKTSLKPIETMQKKALRIIANTSWDAHTNILFNELKILKFIDIFKY